MQPPYPQNDGGQQPDTDNDTIHHLAAAITRAGLHAPVALTLDILTPIDFISSQVVLFIHPFVRGHPWEQYTAILTDESRWQELRHWLRQQPDNSQYQQHCPEQPPGDKTRRG